MRRFPTDNHQRPSPRIAPQGSPQVQPAAGAARAQGIGDHFAEPGAGAPARAPEVAEAAKWPTVEAGALARPEGPARAAPTETIARGQPVKMQVGGDVVAGALAGYDYQGRPVVGAGRARRIGEWDAVEVDGVAHEVALPTVGLPEGALVKPPEKLAAALDEAFETAVCGAHTAREYIDALHDDGHFVYLTGGAIRDALRMLTLEPDAPTAKIIETLKDIDIVTTAPPPVVRAVAERIGPEHKDGGVWTPPIVDQFGSVLLGGPKAGLPNPEGLDVTSMKAEGAFAEQVYHRDTNEKAFPYTFDHSLQLDARSRDFSCNSLYYDPLNRVIVDPTGGEGLEDARANRLRIAPGFAFEHDDSIALRFWKFRMRGFDADAGTIESVRRQANHVLWNTPRWKVVNNIARIVPKDAKTANDVQRFFRKLGSVMHKDGNGRLFREHLRPMMDKVIRKVENRAKRAGA